VNWDDDDDDVKDGGRDAIKNKSGWMVFVALNLENDELERTDFLS